MCPVRQLKDETFFRIFRVFPRIFSPKDSTAVYPVWPPCGTGVWGRVGDRDGCHVLYNEQTIECPKHSRYREEHFFPSTSACRGGREEP
jgi:hypothetical protein